MTTPAPATESRLLGCLYCAPLPPCEACGNRAETYEVSGPGARFRACATCLGPEVTAALKALNKHIGDLRVEAFKTCAMHGTGQDQDQE